jgi:hypothetical protein
MSDQINELNDQDYRVQIESIILAVAQKMDQTLSQYDLRLEQIEKQIATLVVGFGEQAVFMEALISQVAFSTDEARKAFNDTMNESRKQMLTIMKEGADEFLGSTDPNLASAVEELATEKLSNET